jgi:hypothetical protein
MSWAEHHKTSEELANAAELAGREGKSNEAEDLYRRAASAERAAFDELDTNKTRTRGITAVSAVALAYKGRDLRAAQEFAYKILSGEGLPLFAVAEVRNLLQALWSDEALSAAGVRFSTNDVLVSVKGGEIQTGGAPLDLILRKVEEVRAIFYRTVELLMDVPLRLRGGPSYDIQQLFRPWLFQAPAGSYQFAVRLEGIQQLELGLDPRRIPPVDEVTRKFLEIVHSAASDPDNQLVATVPKPDYRNTFLKLTRNLAPTGKSFSELEIRSNARRESGPVVFVPNARKAINETIKKAADADRTPEGITTSLIGILRAVHLDQDWIEVTIREPTEKHIRVEKAGEVIDDVIGPMVNRPVQVDVEQLTTGKFIFRDIQAVE